MALKGNLHDFSITQLLNLIHLARKTGTLAVDGKSAKTDSRNTARIDRRDNAFMFMLHGLEES